MSASHLRAEAAIRDAQAAVHGLAAAVQVAQDPHLCERNRGPVRAAWGMTRTIGRAAKLCARASRVVRRVVEVPP